MEQQVASTSIKRVISDPEEEFEHGRKTQRTESPDHQMDDANFLAIPTPDRPVVDSPMTEAPANAPTVVECEEGTVDTTAPLSHIPRTSSRNSTTSSSLSDDQTPSDQGTSNHDMGHGHTGAMRYQGEANSSPMIRNDSKLSTDSSASMIRSVENSSGNWGWFEDVHGTSDVFPTETKKTGGDGRKGAKGKGGLLHAFDDSLSPSVHDHNMEAESEAMAVTAPTYVLEESLSSQQLWKHTAGTRPPQPVEERAFYEAMWAQNFARSQVKYHMPVEVLTATSPISLSPFADGNFEGNGARPEYSDYSVGPQHSHRLDKSRHEEVAFMKKLHDPQLARHIGLRVLQPHRQQPIIVNKKVKGSGSHESMTVLVRGDNVFGTTVSKSFAKKDEKGFPIDGVDTVNISIASYRVVESKTHGKYAQFLVIYREGGIRDTMGVWKRYSDFVELSRKVMEAHISCASVLASMSPLSVTKEQDVEHLPNAIMSWRLLKKRQRWYRCLDAGYLSLKVFLLERFLHDILFESSSPKMLRDFVIEEV